MLPLACNTVVTLDKANCSAEQDIGVSGGSDGIYRLRDLNKPELT